MCFELQVHAQHFQCFVVQKKRKEIPGNFVCTVVLGDFLAEEEHSFVPLHLLVDGLVEGVSDRDLPAPERRGGAQRASSAPHCRLHHLVT